MAEKGLFTNAKFGDIYMSRDGQENVFCSLTVMNGEKEVTRMYRKDFGVLLFYMNGQLVGNGHDEENEFDIVCRKTVGNQIDEESISQMALVQYPPRMGKYGDGAREGYVQGFKDAIKMEKM